MKKELVSKGKEGEIRMKNNFEKILNMITIAVLGSTFYIGSYMMVDYADEKIGKKKGGREDDR